MSLLLTLVATLSASSAVSTVPAVSVANSAAEKPVATRSKARVTLTASATIIKMEKVSPLATPEKLTTEIERPIAKQRTVKSGVPYVEFY